MAISPYLAILSSRNNLNTANTFLACQNNWRNQIRTIVIYRKQRHNPKLDYILGTKSKYVILFCSTEIIIHCSNCIFNYFPVAKSTMIIYLFSVVVFKFCLKERGFFVPCASERSHGRVVFSHVTCFPHLNFSQVQEQKSLYYYCKWILQNNTSYQLEEERKRRRKNICFV